MRSAHAAFSRCVAICERHGLARFAIMNEAMLAIIDTWLGNGDEALQRLARSRATARELRHRLAEAMNEEVTGWMLVLQGRFEEAEVFLIHCLALSREIGARRYEIMCLLLLARIDHWRREPGRAREKLNEAWEISGQISHGFIGAAVQGAMALVAAGDEERHNALAKGEALLQEHSIAHCHFWFNRDAIQVSLESGAWSEAERYADALEARMRSEPLPWTEFPVTVARLLAAAGRGDPDRAALRACRAQAVALRDVAYLPALDAALARLPPA